VALGLVLTTCVSTDPANESAQKVSSNPRVESFLPDELDPANAGPEGPPNQGRRDLKAEEYAHWETNPARAMSKARALDRPLLLLFTALSWSRNARLLGEEVFLSRSFNELARKHLVIVYLDFPKNTSEAPRSHRKLKKHYDVSGLPAVVLVDGEGRLLFETTGYTPGKARDYFRELEDAVLAAGGDPEPAT